MKGFEVTLGKTKLVAKDVDDDGKVKVISVVRGVFVARARSQVEHLVLGAHKNVVQDMGRVPVRIVFDGVVTGPKASSFIEDIYKMFVKGEAVDFSTNLPTLSNITKVLIRGFDFTLNNTLPVSYRYVLTVVEHRSKKPKKKEEGLEVEVEAGSPVKEHAKKVKKKVEESKEKAGKKGEEEGLEVEVKIGKKAEEKVEKEAKEFVEKRKKEVEKKVEERKKEAEKKEKELGVDVEVSGEVDLGGE